MWGFIKTCNFHLNIYQNIEYFTKYLDSWTEHFLVLLQNNQQMHQVVGFFNAF
jgi:hypothetical protein